MIKKFGKIVQNGGELAPLISFSLGALVTWTTSVLLMGSPSTSVKQSM